MKKYADFMEPIVSEKALADIKVTNAVGTFLKEDTRSLQKARVLNTKSEPEKVTNTVGTFLKEGNHGFQQIRVMIKKSERKKVTNTVGTFLN